MRARSVLLAAIVWSLALPLLILLSPVVQARPGGGHSYSGGSHSSGSSHSSSPSSSHRSGSSSHGTSSSEGLVFVFLFMLFMVVIMALIMHNALRRLRKFERTQSVSWDSRAAALTFGPEAAEPPPQTLDLASIRETDAEFSLVLFEDFAYALYARAHKSRHSASELSALSPYLAEAERGHLAARAPVGAPVRAVCVGAMCVGSVNRNANETMVELGFEANLVVAAPQNEITQYVKESWTVKRPISARTRPWKGVRTFGCPSCGAPLASIRSSVCASCGQRVDDGRFDWMVTRIRVDELGTRPPALTGTVEERGTDLPTVLQPDYEGRRDELLRDDPALSPEGLDARLRLIYAELQRAWAAQDLSGVRPFVSSGLYNYLDYWVSAYKQQGLRNVVDGARIERSRLVRVLRDAHYDAVTFRVWGNGRDYTERVETGEVVGGSRRQDRPYTEYWTLIRGAKTRGVPRTDNACPSCGAGLKVNMEGNCEYCRALVASGDFDWVLSKIEQDDSYAG
jgi:hypothetical protein